MAATWAEAATISQVVITPLVVITPVVGWPQAAHVVGANGREAGRSLVMCVCVCHLSSGNLSTNSVWKKISNS